MNRKAFHGICHICGTHGQLSFEHVPPKAAFNRHPIRLYNGVDALKLIELGPEVAPKGTIQQRGAGRHTLCERCNNLTGSWYVPSFVEWCYQWMDILEKAGQTPTIYYPYWIWPLPTIKQIATMFFSANSESFQEAHSELVSFVLNKEKRYLSPKYRFFTYYTTSAASRSIGMAGKANVYNGSVYVMSEIAFRPFGYVLTLVLCHYDFEG